MGGDQPSGLRPVQGCVPPPVSPERLLVPQAGAVLERVELLAAAATVIVGLLLLLLLVGLLFRAGAGFVTPLAAVVPPDPIRPRVPSPVFRRAGRPPEQALAQFAVVLAVPLLLLFLLLRSR